MDNEGEVLDARKQKKASGKTTVWILLVVIVILAIAIGALAYPLLKNKLKESLPFMMTTATTTVTASATATAGIDAGVTWITPVKLADLGFFKKNDNFEGLGGLDVVYYYKVGTTITGEDIIDAVLKFSPAHYEVNRIIKKSDGYYKVVKNSFVDNIGSDEVLEVGLKSDTTTEFKSLEPDESLTKGTTKLTYSYNGDVLGGSATKITDTAWGGLYREDSGDAPDTTGLIHIDNYFIKLNDSTKAYYTVAPTFLRDDGTLDIAWSNQSKKNLGYQKVETSGCGGGAATFPRVVNTSVLSAKEQVAPDAKMYFISDKNNALDQYIYKIYKKSADPDAKSIDSFIENIGMLVWTDDYGSSIVYSNMDYSFEGECGKPVVYLYPDKPTSVTVKVGAKITKSEPEYGTGWRGIANPDGRIIVGGKTYPYLFWEGLGLGQYPQITAGTVIPTSQVEKTIKTQLAEIGLNQKETADFLEFWLPKMPQTEFVRLSWFQNKQMDELAPLKISPKPDTMIRVFLDFAGLDQKINLPPQNLEHITRYGFTAVEWGGLLSK